VCSAVMVHLSSRLCARPAFSVVPERPEQTFLVSLETHVHVVFHTAVATLVADLNVIFLTLCR
jgi:hypothetical protein